MDTVFVVIILATGIIGLTWFFVPIFSGLPWVPTNEERVRIALRLADLKPGELLFDLGSGDGRVPLIAAREFGAHATGIEISPLHCLLALFRAWRAGLGKYITIRWMSYYRADLSRADVIYFYGHGRFVEKLKLQLTGHIKDGARLISISTDVPGWMPEKIDQEYLVFVYRMPPAPGDVVSFMMREASSE